MTLPSFNTDNTWTLFLDRDGVINVKRDNDYVKNWGEFIFLEGVLEAITILSRHFARIIIVTNQRGIGRKWMTNEDVEGIHQKMLEEIEKNEGRIDHILFCPDLAEDDHKGWRKPKPGMAFEAKKIYPEIEFKKSLIIGDSISDMQFGKNAGMNTVWLSNQAMAPEHGQLIDGQIESLFQFAMATELRLKKEEKNYE